MDETELFDLLCWRDPRYPTFKETWGDEDPKWIPQPRTNCSCDNCFYGRDPLALEILRLQEELKKYEPNRQG